MAEQKEVQETFFGHEATGNSGCINRTITLKYTGDLNIPERGVLISGKPVDFNIIKDHGNCVIRFPSVLYDDEVVIIKYICIGKIEEFNKGNNIIMREEIAIDGVRWITFLQEKGDTILKVRKSLWNNNTTLIGFSPELRDSIITAIGGMYG